MEDRIPTYRAILFACDPDPVHRADHIFHHKVASETIRQINLLTGDEQGNHRCNGYDDSFTKDRLTKNEATFTIYIYPDGY